MIGQKRNKTIDTDYNALNINSLTTLEQIRDDARDYSERQRRKQKNDLSFMIGVKTSKMKESQGSIRLPDATHDSAAQLGTDYHGPKLEKKDTAKLASN